MSQQDDSAARLSPKPPLVVGGRLAIARVLSDSSRVHVDKVFVGREGATALMYAASHGYEEETRALLAAGADRRKADPSGRTAILLACENGHRAVCDLLVVAGSLDEEADNHGAGVWHLGYPHRGIRAWLLEQAADPNRPDAKGFTPLHYAAEAGNTAACEDLLKAGADPYARNALGYTALHSAASEGHGPALAVLKQAADRAIARSAADSIIGEEPGP